MHRTGARSTSAGVRLNGPLWQRWFWLALPLCIAVTCLARAAAPVDPSQQRFPGGAALKTDPEQQRLLQRAEQYAQEGRPDLAAILFQKVLDEAGETLTVQQVIEPAGPTSTPLVVYNSLGLSVEQTILRLPPAVLMAYRTTADAEARALLAAAMGADEEQALAQVARRFFLSSTGDDAAYQLACLALDRHDFVGAFRWLSKIVATHPDSSLPKAELLARLAIAAAHVQDQQTADQAVTQLLSASGPRPSAEVIDLIIAEVKRVASQAAAETSSTAKDWPLTFGNPSRTGQMAALPASATPGTLAELWTHEFALTPAATPSAAASGVSRSDLVALWREGGWRPTGQLLFAGSSVFFKTPDRLVCFGAAAASDQPSWQSAWQNRYELDAMSQQFAIRANAVGGSLPQRTAARPTSLTEVLLFGDRVHASLALAEGVVYSLEGKRLTASGASQPRGRPLAVGSAPRRARSNWLTAYQASGGKALWTRTAGDDDQTDAAGLGFLAAPTPCGDLLVVPVTDGGTIWLYGLARSTGKTLWKTHLCDEPQGGAPPWAQPVLAVAGRDVYLTCGCGVVFAVDSVGGDLRWVVRYAREAKSNLSAGARDGANDGPAFDFGGWDDDVVIPHGRLLVVMASDADRLLALDRRTGERAWESPRTSPLGSVANYCLGVHGSSLFVAGKNVVRRYDIPSGRLLQERPLADSFGRGCLTADAVYLPVGDSILKLDVELKQILAQVSLALISDEPVGNLFSDGEKLWVVGAGRVYATTTLDRRLTVLDQQIAAGNAAAQLRRMRLHFKQNRPELALADLRGAYERFQTQLSADEAALRLFAALGDERLPQAQPLTILPLLTELFFSATPPPKLSREVAERLADVVASCIRGIRQHKPAGAVAALLAAAPLYGEDYLQTAATLAIEGAATSNDVPALLAAIQHGPALAQRVSIRAAVHLAPAAAKKPLAQLLQAEDDRARLAAARALANLGERKDVLETLVALLGSSQVAVRSRSHQTLQALTSQRIPFAPEGSAADRAAAIQAWGKWVANNASTAQLSVPLTDRSVRLGRTLLVTTGVLVELDADHQERWRGRLAGAAWGCQGLPNGHRLVALHAHSMVVEYDDRGQEVWRKDRLPAPPTSVERLENGNTLVACANAQQIVEIAPDGTVTSLPVPGTPIWAQRLDSGNTLVALQQPIQRVVEVDSTGKIAWEARTGGNPPAHAVRMENGNTLVTLTQARKVVEFDPTGKSIVWSSQVSLLGPFAAQRLPSGNTLVADQTGVREIDPTGLEFKWQQRLPPVTGLSSF